MADFKEAYKLTAAVEGGYVNDPKDAGGETYKGIARRYWPNWPGWKDIDRYAEQCGGYNDSFHFQLAQDAHLKNLVYFFYYKHFWSELKGDQLPEQVIANELYDTAVNQGVQSASAYLQEALNLLNDGGEHYPDIAVDGRIGPATLRALDKYLAARPGQPKEKKIQVLFKALNGLQFKRYVDSVKKRPTNERYFYGWVNTRIGVLLVLLGLLVSSGCRSAKELTTEVSKTDTARVDSIVYQERLVPYPVEVPGDVLHVTLPSPCDSAGYLKPIKQEFKGPKTATVKVASQGNDLLISGGCDTWMDSVLVLSTRLEEFRERKATSNYSHTNIKHVPVTPKWLRWPKLILYFITTAAIAYVAGHYRLATRAWQAFRILIKLKTGI